MSELSDKYGSMPDDQLGKHCRGNSNGVVKYIREIESKCEEWHPIEEAPQDGTMVDLWTHSVGRIPLLHWNLQSRRWEMPNGLPPGHFVYTHYRRDPSPPESIA